MLAYILGVPLIFGVLGGSVLCAGPIHEDLAALVFWVEFLSLPFVAVAVALVIGLRMREAVAAPLDSALAPMLGLPASEFSAEAGRRWIDAAEHLVKSAEALSARTGSG